MSSLKYVIFSFLTILAVGGVTAQSSHDETHGQVLIPPQRILKNAGRVGISEQQQKEIREAIQAIHNTEDPEARQAEVQAAGEALRAALASDELNEKLALKKLNDLLAAEAAMKRIQLKIMIAANRILTSAQRKELAGQPGKAGKGMRRRQANADIKAPELPEAATPEELKSRIDQWRAPDVAWRKIQWKTCLLEGIAASAEEKKPIIVWMFIDLPRDDRRC